MQLTATDADDPTYGNSARVVYSILEGQPYFSVDAKTGKTSHMTSNHNVPFGTTKRSVTSWFYISLHEVA